MNKIGNKIRQLREMKGFSQDCIAMELGISQSSYARLEKKDCRINITRLIHIANILKTTVTELIDEASLTVSSQQENQEVYSYLNSVIESDKEHIKSLKEEISFLKKLLKEKKD